MLFGQPDVTVIVVDATRLERNLNLVLQVLEITDRAVVCLNLMDEARRRGIGVDAAKLSTALGVPVVPTAARSKEGIPELVRAIHEVATGTARPMPFRIQQHPPEVESAVASLASQIRESYPELPTPARSGVCRRLSGVADSGELPGAAKPPLGGPAPAQRRRARGGCRAER